MSFSVTPHLNFDGKALEALTFYGKVFASDINSISYAQAGQADVAKRPDDIIWGQVMVSPSQPLMAFDVRADQSLDAGTQPFYLVLNHLDADAITEKWQALSKNGQIIVPLATSAWSPLYGMVTDEFGITWVLSVPGNNAS